MKYKDWIKGSGANAIKMILEAIGGIALALIGFLCLLLLRDYCFSHDYGLDFLASKRGIGVAMLITVTAGSILGIVSVDKFLSRPRKCSIPGIIMGVVLGSLAGCFGISLFDAIGGAIALAAYLCIVAVLSLIGYHLGSSLRQKMKTKKQPKTNHF